MSAKQSLMSEKTARVHEDIDRMEQRLNEKLEAHREDLETKMNKPQTPLQEEVHRTASKETPSSGSQGGAGGSSSSAAGAGAGNRGTASQASGKASSAPTPPSPAHMNQPKIYSPARTQSVDASGKSGNKTPPKYEYKDKPTTPPVPPSPANIRGEGGLEGPKVGIGSPARGTAEQEDLEKFLAKTSLQMEEEDPKTWR